MQTGYVLNIYDSLNYDIGFECDIEGDSVIHEKYVYCQTDNVLDPCLQNNLPFDDISKLNLSVHEYSDDDYVSPQSEPFSVQPSSKLSVGNSYRCHLKDLRFRNNAKLHPDYGNSKKILIQWSDYSNGFVLCKIHNIDTYNRLIVELFDPFSRESYKTYLIKNFPTIFCLYQTMSNTTIKLNELPNDRKIPRPKTFQLPDCAHRPYDYDTVPDKVK